MITLIAAAALASAQPAPMPEQAHPMPMNAQQHEAMKKKCCCEDMGEAGHDDHAPGGRPDHQHGR
jgi:hypothetical protein